MESIDIVKMDCGTYLVMQEILSDEIEDEEFLEFAIENFANRLYGFYVITQYRSHYTITTELSNPP